MFDLLLNLDIKWFYLINHNLSNNFLDLFMPLVSISGDGGMIWISIALVLMVPGRREIKIAAFLMLAALFISYLVGEEVLKVLFQRPRPFQTLPGVNLLVPPPGSFSFPSAHTANAFAAGLLLARKIPALIFPALFIAVLMAFSRVYVGVHYPLDVLCGALVGIACALPVLKAEDLLFRLPEKLNQKFKPPYGS